MFIRRQRPENAAESTPPAPPPATVEQWLNALGASEAGLTTAEASMRLDRPLPLLNNQSAAALRIFAGQFSSPLVIILVAAALLSFGLGQASEASIIILIILASCGLGFAQEYRASRIVTALTARLAVKASVLRDGTFKEIDLSKVVEGDVFQLQGGSLVPADAVVLDGRDLMAEEAALTGESFPVTKAPAAPHQVLTDANFVHMGTSIRSGTGRALALHVGAATQYGQIERSALRVQPETAFAVGVRRFGMMLTRVMLVIVSLVLAMNVILGRPALDSLLFAAALAVGLTPELLPAVVTVTQASGARRLAQAGVLVKQLVAIENLGAMEVLCTDKTGTLTEGDVRLDRALDCLGGISAEVQQMAILNARLHTGWPNPLDAAVVASSEEVPAADLIDEVPYDFERKRLSVLVQSRDGPQLICKGAVDQVLSICSAWRSGGAVKGLDPTTRSQASQMVERWSAEGFRVIALATKILPGRGDCSISDEAELILEGYLLFADPPKKEIAATIAALRQRGVKVVIVTGDSRNVALHIGQAIGLGHSSLLTGKELVGLNDRALRRRAQRTEIFAVVTPDQKERVITAIRRSGKVVGYLGDGINDAPSLRAADIGISVDTAVDAAREAADIVLLKQDLTVVLDGIDIGRSAFANTLKYVSITTSANLGNMISMAVASVVLPFLPLLAKQILANNFLSDLPLLAISTDSVDEEILRRPGHWDFQHLLRVMLGFGLVSSAFDWLTFGLLLAVFDADATTFQTAWFIESLLTELIIILVMRTRRAFYSSSPSLSLVGAILAVAAVALALPYIPWAGALALRPLEPILLLTVVTVALGYGLASEILKQWLNGLNIGRKRRTNFAKRAHMK